MRSGIKTIISGTLLGLVSSCSLIGGRGGEPDLVSTPAPSEAPMRSAAGAGERLIADGAPYLGDAYMIGNTRYVPALAARSDEIGYAAVLPDQPGHATANGEAYVPASSSAAHRTLPLPSYVEVTSVENGRTILVRINDRGPMLEDRIIGLSPGAAQQLGVAADGAAPVRVRLVNPLDQERAILREGNKVPERLETPAGLRTALRAKLPAAPKPLSGPVLTLSTQQAAAASAMAGTAGPDAISAGQPVSPTDPTSDGAPRAAVRSTSVPPSNLPSEGIMTPAPQIADGPFIVEPNATTSRSPRGPVRSSQRRVTSPAADGYAIQLGAFSSRERAEMIATRAGASVSIAGALFRVRTGPYRTRSAASAALAKLREQGFAEARVVVNDRR